jgi:hypothetical protein
MALRPGPYRFRTVEAGAGADADVAEGMIPELASWRALSARRLHRYQPVAPGRAGRRLLRQARHLRAMDQRGQGRDQVDAAVVPDLRPPTPFGSAYEMGARQFEISQIQLRRASKAVGLRRRPARAACLPCRAERLRPQQAEARNRALELSPIRRVAFWYQFAITSNQLA